MSDILFSVQDRTIVITGGLGQLGIQFTTALVERGARVAIYDLEADQAKSTSSLCSAVDADQLMTVAVDVTDRASLEDALKRTQTNWETPHGLINCAALDSPPDAPAEENGPFETYPQTSWKRVMDVNVTGTFLACQVIGAAMATEGRGSIINISSIYGMISPDQRIYEQRRTSGEEFYKPVAYSVSKSALFNMTRYLATYWAPANVRVNTVTFGGVFNRQDPAFVDAYCARVPLGRMANPNDYNGAMIFLLSDAATYMTGANIVIDGGWTAW